ncbi:MAG: DUF695 domain-containing protein [Pseudomonadales bacterium]|nr:DUF695 domain-containing protein [Pseudomonadales bacterium]
MASTETVSVVLPQEKLSFIEFSQDDKPGVMMVNAAVKDFEHKTPFAWHLSVLILCQQTVKDNMPSQAEQQLLVEFEERLDKQLRAEGNALYLASITQDGQREVIWRVYNPEKANDFLHHIIDSEDHPRPFEFTLEQDITWAKAKFPLDSLDGEFSENKES